MVMVTPEVQRPLATAVIGGDHALCFPRWNIWQGCRLPYPCRSRDGRMAHGNEQARAALEGRDMPRYFFNVYYERAELDEEGEELPDAQAAWHEATVTAGQIIQDLDGKLRLGQDWRLEVTDEFANPLYVIDVRADRAK
jgi:hypothetical protein